MMRASRRIMMKIVNWEISVLSSEVKGFSEKCGNLAWLRPLRRDCNIFGGGAIHLIILALLADCQLKGKEKARQLP